MKCLKMAMIKYDTSTAQIAKALGKHVNTINSQKRSSDIKYSILKEYADYFGIPVSELVRLGE